MTLKNLQDQTGSAIFYILIAVVLFAALGIAVSNMMRGPVGGSISNEKAGILAAEILSYAQQVKSTVQDLLISNDCEDTDISFENNIVSGYEHTPAARDKCKVFGSDGGGLSWQSPTEKMNEGSEWYFTGLHPIHRIGSTSVVESELLLMLEGVSQEVCAQINVILGNPEQMLDSHGIASSNSRFDGTYITGPHLGNSGDPADKKSGCFYNPPSEKNFFYYTLIAR